jgi:hypothetical protein
MTSFSTKFNPKGGRTILFKNIGKRNTTCNNSIQIPSFCQILQAQPFLKISCPIPVVVDGVQQTCTVGFEPGDLWLEVNGVKLSARFPVPITDASIAAIIHLISCMKLCNGSTNDDGYIPRTFKQERMSTTYNSDEKLVLRSKHCHYILEWLATQDKCISCNLTRFQKYKERKRKHLQEMDNNTCLHENTETSKKKREQIKVPEQIDVPSADKENQKINNPSSPSMDLSDTDNKSTDSKEIVLNERDHKDMEDVIQYVLQSDVPDQSVVLLKSQLQNCKKSLDVHQRRWDPKIISLCLTLFIRSPQAYQDLKKSNFLELPSKRLLQYYKNAVKQSPGFNEANLNWMAKEMVKQNVPEFGRHGGIVIDEMTIQDDLIITKSGDTWNLVGYLDMGTTNNNIETIMKDKKKVNLATHALQFVFHGFTGFRYVRKPENVNLILLKFNFEQDTFV